MNFISVLLSANIIKILLPLKSFISTFLPPSFVGCAKGEFKCLKARLFGQSWMMDSPPFNFANATAPSSHFLPRDGRRVRRE